MYYTHSIYLFFIRLVCIVLRLKLHSNHCFLPRHPTLEPHNLPYYSDNSFWAALFLFFCSSATPPDSVYHLVFIKFSSIEAVSSLVSSWSWFTWRVGFIKYILLSYRDKWKTCRDLFIYQTVCASWQYIFSSAAERTTLARMNQLSYIFFKKKNQPLKLELELVQPRKEKKSQSIDQFRLLKYFSVLNSLDRIANLADVQLGRGGI